MGPGHVSRWPPYWSRDRRRTPAALRSAWGCWFVVGPGGDRHLVRSHTDVLEVACEHKFDVYVGSLGHYPWLADAIAQPGTTTYAGGRNQASGLSCRWHHYAIRIGESRAWGYDHPDGRFLRDLEGLFRLVDVGAYVTPAALGMAAMVRIYKQLHHPYQSRPNSALRAALLEHRVGARSDPAPPDIVIDECYELDLHDAYAWAASQPLPVGTAVGIGPGEDPTGDRYAYWFGRCYCHVPRGLTNSPFLVRDSTGRLVPLTAHGEHEIWCRKPDAEALRAIGCTVILCEGWGWTAMAPLLAEFAEKMTALRASSADLAGLVKMAVVAGLGRHGMPPISRRLIPLADAPDGAPLADATPGQGRYCVVTGPDEENSALHHWYDCILMRVRLWQWERRRQEEADGNVVLATDTDALYVLYPTERDLDPVALGGVRQRIVSSSRFPYDRALISREKTKLPGIPRGSPLREEYINGHNVGPDAHPAHPMAGGGMGRSGGSAAAAYALAIREAHERRRDEPQPIPRGYEKLDPESGELVWHDGTPHGGFRAGWEAMRGHRTTHTDDRMSGHSGDAPDDGDCLHPGDPASSEPIGGRRRLGGPRRRSRD